MTQAVVGRSRESDGKGHMYSEGFEVASDRQNGAKSECMMDTSNKTSDGQEFKGRNVH